MPYLFDNQVLFDAALAKLSVLPEPMSIEPYVGQPGVRDPDHPCDVFEPGQPDGDYESDGHCICEECKHLKREKWLAWQQPEQLTYIGCKRLLEAYGVQLDKDPNDFSLGELREIVWEAIRGGK